MSIIISVNPGFCEVALRKTWGIQAPKGGSKSSVGRPPLLSDLREPDHDINHAAAAKHATATPKLSSAKATMPNTAIHNPVVTSTLSLSCL